MNNKIFKKIIPILLVISLTFANIMFLSVNVVSNAIGVSMNYPNKTNNSIEFNVFFKHQDNKSNTLIGDINNPPSIGVELNVKEGYLKNASIQFISSNQEQALNYKLTKTDLDEIIQKIEENKIELKQIDSAKFFSIPIGASLDRLLDIYKLNQISKAVLKGTHINEQGKEIEIEQEVELNLGWEANVELDINQNILRYIILEDKVLLQMEVNVGLLDNNTVLPLKESNIEINVPNFNGISPEQVSVFALKTELTNGQTQENMTFDSNNWNYDSQQKTIKINVQNQVIDDKIVIGNNQDKYLVTYEYGQEVLDSITQDGVVIESIIKANATIYSNNGTKTIEKQTGGQATLKEQIGEVVSYEISNSINQMYKGKIYANYEIEYDTQWKVNVADIDYIEAIKLYDVQDGFLHNNVESSLSGNYRYKQTKISKTNFEQVMGQDGVIKILDSQGNELFSINKDTQADEQGYIYLNYEGNVEKIRVEISKPINSGDLIIQHTKILKSNLPYNKSELQSFDQMYSKMNVQIKYLNQKYMKLEEKQTVIKLLETNTKVDIQIDKDTLSTVANNEGVNITLKLNNNREASDLYKNPEFLIRFPSDIKDIEIKDIYAINNSNLSIEKYEKYLDGGNLILKIIMKGEQTLFNESSITAGTNIIINADIKLDLVTPTKQEKIEVFYSNENALNYDVQIEHLGYNSCDIKFLAPIGLLNIATISNYNTSKDVVTSVNQGEVVKRIEIFEPERIATMKLTIINNEPNSCSQVEVLGRIPFKDNKDILTGQNLGTTVDALMVSHITPIGIDVNNVTIYYSENGEASKHLGDSNNGWTTNPQDFTKVRSYLIVLNNYELTPSQVIEFTYDFKIPANLNYNNSLFGSSGTFYNSNSEMAILAKDATPDKVGLTTGSGPELEAELNISTGNESNVTEGTRVKYTAIVRNVGGETATNVVVTCPVPENTTYTEYMTSPYDYTSRYVNDSTVKEKVFNIPELKSGEERVFEYEVYINKLQLLDAPNDEETNPPEGTEQDGFIIPQVIIINMVNLAADNVSKTIESNKLENLVQKAKFILEINSSRASDNFFIKGETIRYSIHLENIHTSELNNITVTDYLPEGVIYEQAYALMANPETLEFEQNTEIATYDEQSRLVTFNIGNMGRNEQINMTILVTTDTLPENEYSRTILNRASVLINGQQEAITSYIENNIVCPRVEISQSSSKSGQYIKEGEELTYNIKVRNIGQITASNIIVEDTIPDELIIKNISYTVNGNTHTISTPKDKIVKIKTHLPVGQDLIVNITTVADSILDEQERDIENVAKVYFDDTKELTSNVIRNTIEKSDEDIPPSGPTYKIRGLAWLDENKDGARDDTEKLLKDITVKLVKNSNNTVVKTIKTGEDGAYIFENIPQGSYFIEFEYDTRIYTLTKYRQENVAQDRNSDAVETRVTQDGQQTTKIVTEPITISNSSISNIDIGLILNEQFKLTLDKYITNVIVQRNNYTRTYDFGDSKFAKIDIAGKDLVGTTVFMEYKIVIKNEGSIAGYVKNIVDYIPTGTKFSSDMNPDWHIGRDNNLYNTSLADTILQPGEQKEVKLILSKAMTENNTGLVNNIAEIYEIYNDKAVPDISSTSGNKVQGEDDMDNADLLISIQTGEIYLYIITGIVATGMLIIGIYFINKKVLIQK